MAVPEPFVTVQFCVGVEGCVLMVTAYAPLTAVLNVNGAIRIDGQIVCPVVLQDHPGSQQADHGSAYGFRPGRTSS